MNPEENQVSRKPAGSKPVKKPKLKKRKPSPEKKQHIAAVLILLLTLYLAVNLAVFGILLLDFNRQPGNTQSYTLVLKKNKTRVATVDAALVNNKYGLYVPYSKLSLLADLSIMGDNDNVIIIVRPGDDRVEISSNSSLIYINDNAIRLSKPVIFQINDYLLPIELISNYMDGISVTYDDKNDTCTLLRSTEDDAVISAKIAVPDGLGKCSIPPEPPPSQTSSDTSSETSSAASNSASQSASSSSSGITGNTSSTNSH